MKLTYHTSDHCGFCDNGHRSGSFEQPLATSFECDMFWYDDDGDKFIGIGYGRRQMTDSEKSEVQALIGTVNF